jgi:hypothetical protein
MESTVVAGFLKESHSSENPVTKNLFHVDEFLTGSTVSLLPGISQT